MIDCVFGSWCDLGSDLYGNLCCSFVDYGYWRGVDNVSSLWFKGWIGGSLKLIICCNGLKGLGKYLFGKFNVMLVIVEGFIYGLGSDICFLGSIGRFEIIY